MSGDKRRRERRYCAVKSRHPVSQSRTTRPVATLTLKKRPLFALQSCRSSVSFAWFIFAAR